VCKTIDRPPEFLLEVKEKMVPEFLHWAVESIDWGRYSAVGFTSTFNQNLASVTLAKWIKEKYPSVKILFGGSNFDSEMGLEYFRAFDWIDYVLQGEAEPVLPQLMQALKNGGEIPPGVVHRKDGEVVLQDSSAMFEGFEKYGPPDYEDYFEELRSIDPDSPHLENPVILYETARGCWWGEKHHCTFCGLNASTMKFRARPIEQVMGKQPLANQLPGLAKFVVNRESQLMGEMEVQIKTFHFVPIALEQGGKGPQLNGGINMKAKRHVD